MSGPIVPPLEVTEVDGSPDGRPITKIIVSNGDLTISGRTATIDTSGSTTTPGGSDGQVQYNDSGAFGASTILATNKTTSVTITSAATDNDMTLNVVGDGAGTPIINLKNSTKEVRLTCEDDDKLYVRGPTSGERFTFDASSATGGITWPDGTEQITAATGVSFPLEGSDGSAAAPTYSFSADTDTGMFRIGEQMIGFTSNGSRQLAIYQNYLRLEGTSNPQIINCDDASVDLELRSGGATYGKIHIGRENENIEIVPGGTGEIEINGAYKLPLVVTGANDYLLTAQTDGSTAWAAAAGGASAIGELSDATTPTTDNLGLGTGAGASLSGASSNTLVGIDSGTAIVAGSSNTVVGYKALESATGLKQCVVLGYKAGDNFNSAWDAILIGNTAGGDSTSGGLVAIGTYSMKNSSSYGAIGIGNSAGQYTRGNYAIAIGDNALKGPSDETGDGVQNVGIGYNAGRLVSTGERNIFIGNYCADLHTTGSGCVLIGDTIETTAVDTDQELRIAGNDGTTTVTWVLGDSTGSCYQGDNASTWSTTSDQILKREIEDATSGLDAINQVRVRTFRYIERATPITEVEKVKSSNPDDEGFERINIVGYEGENTYNLDPEPRRTGVIAQEIQEVFPEAVTENEKGHLTVNHDSINWALLKAVQELSAKVEALEAA